MWTKTSKPASVTLPVRTPAVPRAAAAQPVRPTRVLQSRRVPQQLSFEFRRV
jgi:hypothetical protein